MMAILVQLLSLCFKLLKKVGVFLSYAHILKFSLKDNVKEKLLLNFAYFKKKAETNCFNSSQFQMENNRWVSVTNKDSVDGKT